MIAQVTHIIPLTMIRRERVLDFPGKILVRKGQKVGAADVIAETNLHAEHVLLDVARALGVPVSKVDKYLKVQTGDTLDKGDLIAGPVGFPRRSVYAQDGGQVVLADSGQVLIEVAGQPFQLKAAIPGEVVELVSDRGAIVEATGALIQCVWGNGPIEFGLMSILAKTPDHVLTPDQLDVSQRGSIVFAGYCDNEDVFRTAEELPLRGLILGSMSAKLAAAAAHLPYPVVLLEGFGKRLINPVTFQLLSTSERRDVAVNAEPWDALHGKRPELVIPLPADTNLTPPRDTDVFALDQQVRVLRAPYTGMIGTIVMVKGATAFPSGLNVPAADVRLGSGDTVAVPLVNLEIVA